MATFEIDLNEKGEIVKFPDEIQKFVNKLIKQTKDEVGTKAAEDAKAQIEAEVKKAREEERNALIKAGGDPAAVEKAKSLEGELSKMREAEAERAKNYDAAKAEIEKRHAASLAEKDAVVEQAKAEVERRNGRIRDLALAHIRVEALKQGAREETLSHVESLLGSQIGLDTDTLEPFVVDLKDRSKKRLGDDGKTPVAIEGLVSAFLTEFPVYKAAPEGRGGGRGGGRSLSGQPTGADAEFKKSVADVEKDPSIANVARAFAQVGKRPA